MYKNQLKKIRIEKGMALLELSNKSGVSIGYLCHLEKGSRKKKNSSSNLSFELIMNYIKD